MRFQRLEVRVHNMEAVRYRCGESVWDDVRNCLFLWRRCQDVPHIGVSVDVTVPISEAVARRVEFWNTGHRRCPGSPMLPT